MLPAAFEYAAPETLDEALALLSQRDDSRVLAGGQSLIPLMKFRLASPGFLVDINRIPGADSLEEREGVLHIGALVRHRQAERSAVLAAHYPLMAEAARQVADPIVRNRGTLAGSVAHADPSGDWGAVMLALDAEFEVRSQRGSRTIPAREFFSGPFTTVLNPGEAITEIRVPTPRPPSGGAYQKLERKIGDFATVGVAVQLELDDGTVRKAGIGLAAVGPQNIKATAAEELLRGERLTDDLITEAARRAADAAEPRADLRGSEAYKRNVVRVFTERGLKRAYERARGGG